MSIVGKNPSRQILLKYCTKNSFAPVFVAVRVGRILPSADVIIVNRFKLEINMLNPSRNSHSFKIVGGRTLEGEEEGENTERSINRDRIMRELAK